MRWLPADQRTPESWSQQMGHNERMMILWVNAVLLQHWWGRGRLDPCQPGGPFLPGCCHLHPPPLDAQLRFLRLFTVSKQSDLTFSTKLSNSNKASSTADGCDWGKDQAGDNDIDALLAVIKPCKMYALTQLSYVSLLMHKLWQRP